MFLIATFGLCTRAMAEIDTINFSGSGVVTYNQGGDGGLGFFYPPAPISIGDPVTVTGTIWLGDATFPSGVPDTFTGTLIVNADQYVRGMPGFKFVVKGGDTSDDTRFGINASLSEVVTLSYGRLTGLSLVGVNDPDSEGITAAGPSGRGIWGSYVGYTFDAAHWGGTWRLDEPVPEPATWALLLTGFCGLGLALRASRRAGCCAA